VENVKFNFEIAKKSALLTWCMICMLSRMLKI